jgi:hypothetical protein
MFNIEDVPFSEMIETDTDDDGVKIPLDIDPKKVYDKRIREEKGCYVKLDKWRFL